MLRSATSEVMGIGRAGTLVFWLLAVLVTASTGVLLAANPAQAATFTVNGAGDAPDADLANAACDANASKGGNQCTLRAAIEESNETSGADVIRFDIPDNPDVPGLEVKTISPASPLPDITEQVSINGYTQRGARANTLAEGNDAVLKIQLNGANAGPSATGLEIRGPNSTIKGLVINRFVNGVSIILDQATGNKVEGNFIGTNAKGTAERGNGVRGVVISDAPDNTVGGTQPARRNVISGNGFFGVLINGRATGNEVEGNFIGTNASGTQDLGNIHDGVNIAGGSNNTIGGTAAGARNVISGNDENGVEISGSGATGNKVQGNFIGTSAKGTGDLGNAANGVSIDLRSSNHTVGGTDADDGAVDGVVQARNVISGNGENGVEISGSGATGNKVQGNFIGTNKGGSGDLGNAANGVSIFTAPDNTVGGTAAGAGNVISGNDENGVQISGSATGNEVLGNLIGTNATGNADLGNIQDGVRMFNASDNTIGGTTSAARNIISGNDGVGFQVFNASSTGNRVQGNYIGTDVSGTQALGNGLGGVFIGSASNNTIGGTAAGAGNTISGNQDEGVAIFGLDATGNKVEGNRIGTTADGTGALPNSTDGVLIQNAPDNIVGGTDSGARNIISGNRDNGVAILGELAGDNDVLGNFIGTTATGNAALGNDGDGVDIFGAEANTIGGTSAAAGNIISANAGDGVVVQSGSHNRILSNRIFSNGGLGIDLAANGVTNNDPDDPDTGANNLQNFPVITGAARSSSLERTAISGTINSTPNQSFTIQCFVADGDSSNHGEAPTFLTQDTGVTTNSSGDGEFLCESSGARAGDKVSATATNTATSFDTSEFSLNRTVIPVP